MRRRISLYINGAKADLTDQSFLLFTYTAEDLTNPAVVKNSYSQTVTLPGTKANNAIFGDFFRADRVTGSGAFDPLARTPFVIYDELGQVLESGYCKLATVQTAGGTVSYSVQLFGGLGSFFYALTYKDDGTKRTLADLQYIDETQAGTVWKDADEISWPITAAKVNGTWNTLYNDPDSSTAYQTLLQYAPEYNGKPACKFSADKAVALLSDVQFDPGKYPNLYKSKDGYGPKAGASDYIMLEMENEHSDIEMQDLRAYLLRPLINVWRLIVAITDSHNAPSGYSVQFDGALDNTNPYLNRGWMTLPMFDRDNIDPATATLADRLKGTASPADYLISFAKIFGWRFVCDPATKVITIMSRSQFFQRSAGALDITGRIARDRKIIPTAVERKNYIFGYPAVFGENCETYKTAYGRNYGIVRVNTGYELNEDTTEVLSGISLNGAADVLETSRNFVYYGGESADLTWHTRSNYLFKIPFVEKVTWRLYKLVAGELQELECEPVQAAYSLNYYNESTIFADFFPKVQLHAADGKAETGDNVLVLFNGFVDVPHHYTQGHDVAQAVFHLSDDNSAMLALNDGTPCWDITYSGANIVRVERLPSFRRVFWDADSQYGPFAMGYDYSFGESAEEWTGETFYKSYLYWSSWQNYIADRYDRDTKVVTRKVDLSGLQVGPELLRRFYWFDGCNWVLNKITNHSLTTYDLTECEFVQVKDINAY